MVIRKVVNTETGIERVQVQALLEPDLKAEADRERVRQQTACTGTNDRLHIRLYGEPARQRRTIGNLRDELRHANVIAYYCSLSPEVRAGLLDFIERSLDHLGDPAKDGKNDEAVRYIARKPVASAQYADAPEGDLPPVSGRDTCSFWRLTNPCNREGQPHGTAGWATADG